MIYLYWAWAWSLPVYIQKCDFFIQKCLKEFVYHCGIVVLRMGEVMRINRIGHLAKEKGIKNNHIARKLDVSDQTVSRWVNNKAQPNIIQGEVIAEILGVTMEELIQDSDDE